MVIIDKSFYYYDVIFESIDCIVLVTEVINFITLRIMLIFLLNYFL